MNIIGKIKELFGMMKKEDESSSPQQTPTGYETNMVSFGNNSRASQTKFLEEIKGWSFACISAIADEVSSIQIKLFEMKDGAEIEEIKEHKILNLLWRVNNFTTKFDHFWLTQTYLEAVGEAPWFLDKNEETGDIENIFFLQPQRLTPLTSEEQVIVGYSYQISNSKKIIIPPQDVIFLKYPDPVNPFRGKGPMQAAAKIIDTDNFAEEWNKKFFENSARPDTIMKVKGKLTKEQRTKLKRSIEKNYNGKDKSNGIMVLFGDIDYEAFGVNQKDMDFMEQQRYARDKIFGIFRVPKAILSQTEGVNFASAKVAEHVFEKWTIRPKMERLIQQLNEFLLPQFEGTEDMFLDFVDPVTQNKEETLAFYDSGIKSGWLSINEVRSQEGLPSVDGGDTLHIPMNVQSIGTVEPVKAIQAPYNRQMQTKARNQDYFKGKKLEAEVRKELKQALREGLLKKKKVKKKKVAVIKKQKDPIDKYEICSEEDKLKFWKSKNKIFEDNLIDVQKAQEKIFNQQKEDVLERYKDVVKKKKQEEPKIEVDIEKVLLDPKEETDRYLLLMFPIFERIYESSLKETIAFMKEQNPEINVDIEVDDPKVQKFIQKETRRTAKGVTDTTNKLLEKQIKLGIELGEDVSEVATRIESFFDEQEKHRSIRIARTETAKYNVEATQQTYVDSGVVEAKQWVINPLTACQFCREMEGKIVGLETNYFDKGDTFTGDEGGTLKLDFESIQHPPLHPHCNCDLAPVFIKT